MAAYAQIQSGPVPAGTFLTTLQWSPYTDTNAAGFRAVFGTSPETWSSTQTVSGASSTSVQFSGYPGIVYHSAIKAFASDGRESPLSATVSWTNPPLMLSPVVGYKAGVIVYVPLTM